LFGGLGVKFDDVVLGELLIAVQVAEIDRVQPNPARMGWVN
jgi:hypothetical protein